MSYLKKLKAMRKPYFPVNTTLAIILSFSLLTSHDVKAINLPWNKAEASPSNNQKVQTILIATDGLGYFTFLHAQKKGLFEEFVNVGANVSPFPSMTDLSWATLTHTAELFGAEGRIKSVEATYFDESTRSIQGDPRDYYRRLSFPKYYMGAFDSFFNPYVEALMYFPTQEIPKLEIKTVVDELSSAKPKQLLTGYIGAIDSTAHTQQNRLLPVMQTLDLEIKRLIKSYKDRGQEVEIVLVSDHGNIGRFQDGQEEKELTGVDIGKVINRAGLNNVQQLKESKDVGIPLMALGTWGPIYLKDRKNMLPLIEEFKKEVWFDLAVYINKNNSTETNMTVISSNGSANIVLNKQKNTISYYNIINNPLQIPQKYISTVKDVVEISYNDALLITANTNYPDSLVRIAESASERNFDFPDFILTLKDGYYIQSSLGAFTKMYRTHGSLTAKSTYGLLASTKRKIPGQIRTKDILPYLKIDAKELFANTLKKSKLSGQAALKEIRDNPNKGIETEGRDLSQKKIFQHISRFVSDTRPYFLVGEMKTFMEAFKFDPFKSPANQALSPMSFDISKFNVTSAISTEDIGTITDAVLTSGSIENLMKDPRVSKIKERVGLMQENKLATIDSKRLPLKQALPEDESFITKMISFLLPIKRATMKMYQMPFLLEKSIVIQEKPFLPETRDLSFAALWQNEKSSSVTKNSALQEVYGDKYKDKLSKAQMIFKEAFKEADIEDRIYPTQLTKIYNEKIEDLTIVYVPGLYNSIFDKEIFSLGLNALSDELGLRVIQPVVESTCSSDINADLILKYLREDFNSRVQRGHKPPKYLFLSYSKGAVDTLHAFIKNPSFISNYVQGMVAIASPLHGSSILNTTDVPFALVSALSEKQGPEICKSEKAASKSITPTGMEAFWRKNEKSLIGLTRYFSVTFESDPEDSHIFMKATKLIAQFEENNDGVVTVSSSKFPSRINAIDLGTIKADHLSGILSSRFNQKAFMKGLVRTLAELKINDASNNFNINSDIIISQANSQKWKTKTYYKLAKPGFANVWSLNSSSWVEPMVFSNTWELNQLVLPAASDPADNYEVKTKLPQSQLRYDPYAVLDMQKLPDIMSTTKVAPLTKATFPGGINIEYNHQNMVHFRMDYQFNYESRTPGGMDDNKESGYITSDFSGEKNWALMKSKENSIRLTTLAYRFSPLDFPNMSLKIAVTKGVTGADPVKGKSGKDDSAFQVWFTVREGKANGDRTLVDPKRDKVFLFGYYWGDPVNGENRIPQQIFENWYSNKNVVVATLPEAKQLLLNDLSMLGKPQDFKQNLAVDLKKAFPNKNIEDLEIVAITIQHDSNDAKDSSEAYFKRLSFTGAN